MKSSNKVNILDVIPLRKDNISTFIAEDGKVTLGILRFKSKWINKYFMPKRISPEIHVPLDIYGSEVWKTIDGKHSISDIIELVRLIYPDEIGLDERIITYLYRLRHDKLIDFTA